MLAWELEDDWERLAAVEEERERVEGFVEAIARLRRIEGFDNMQASTKHVRTAF